MDILIQNLGGFKIISVTYHADFDNRNCDRDYIFAASEDKIHKV